MGAAATSELDDVAAAQRGDTAAFERLFHLHAPRVRALACWLGSEAEADDITQDVFVGVWRSLAQFDGRASIATWLHRVAVNAILSSKRKASRSPISLEVLENARCLPASRERSAGDTEQRMVLDDLIARLPEPCRHVFVLHDVQGYQHDEIARMLGIPPGTSGSRLHRARQLLRAALHDHE